MLLAVPRRLLMSLVLPALCASVAWADLLPVWQLGTDDDPFAAGYNGTAEFSSENYTNDPRPGRVTRVPADPLYNATNNPTRDDDYYFAGTYPAGFNNLTTNLPVAYDEATSGFERALTDGDRTNRIHFFLNASQTNALCRMRLSFELIWGGVWLNLSNQSGLGFGTHNIEVRFKGTGQPVLLLQKTVDRDSRLIVDFPATNVLANAGPNSIEIVRTGPNLANISQWIQFDYVRLEADTNAFLDADGDGLPRWWEIDSQLSDNDAADAISDRDHDGRTALQEYNGGVNSTNPNLADSDGDGLSDGQEASLGTNPNKVDTDGDSLSDGEEVNGTPASNPLLADSDGDGANDALERRVGSNPLSNTSVPTEFRGGIGIHFVSEADRDGTLGTNEVAGVIPQLRWNDTLPIPTWSFPAGDKSLVTTPLTNRIVRSDGLVLTNLIFSWSGDASAASHNTGSSDRKLMDGFARAYASTPVVINVSGIPFTNYDLYIHVGGSYEGQRARLRLGTDPASDRFFIASTTPPQTEFAEIKPGLTNFQRGNFVRYTNQSATSFTLTVTNLDGWAMGVHAIQIVDRNLDADASGIPDWYELQHKLQPASAALAAFDTDGDGLSNLQEFQRGTDPRNPDTDGDGLSDGVETNTSPLLADTDGDGLSDRAELQAALPSNPNLADSDGDGISDFVEAQRGTDPNYNPSISVTFAGWVPAFKTSPSRWDWNLENIQLVWNHGAGGLAPNIWNEDQLLSLAVKNPASPDWRTFGMELRYAYGRLTYLFHSEPTGGFSYPAQPSWSIWESDYNNPPTDLQTKLGFSGYGPADISSRLQFRMWAQRGSGNSWIVNFAITNQTSNTLVSFKSFTNCTATATVDNGSASWVNYDGATNLCSMVVHQGVQLFITTNLLENLPAFTAARDTDNDGLPDVWETANLLNPNSPADATQDADGDGLSNRDEFLAGTNPRLADTDGDGISDSVERTYLSNPLLATSRPDFAGTPWPTGEDLDGNGLPDAWEVRYRAFGLSPDGDADGDGASNSREAKWGTDPLDANSKPALALARQSNSVSVSWPFVSGKNQSLYSSSTLTNWTWINLPPTISGGSATSQLTNRVAQTNREYYRVATDDRDSDGDGLSDWAEAVLGSDANRANSIHAAMPVLNTNGVVTGSVSGDYAAFVEQMRGGPAGGGPGAITRAQAARLLQQATFGPTHRELDRVQQLGFAAWIDDQITNQPPSLHKPYIAAIYRDFYGPRIEVTYSFNVMDQFINGNNCTTPFARGAVAGPDQLRQRVAFALSQIFVTSRRDPSLENKPLGMTDFYDIFVRNAFGSYHDILREVSMHPVMGRYLSHVGNQKARPELNQYPDENYAREVMQLFSIGLWELNQDGTRKLDALGQPIPTYNNGHITELARVFTGLWFGGQAWGEGGWSDDDYTVPMQLWAEKHDFGAKSLPNGAAIPARAVTAQNGQRDVDDALRSLFQHPNTPPFISKQLIQFLVTSNPSTNYVARVAAQFINNGAGVRGDLAAVIKAILLDPEARDARWFAGAPEFGRLKEPVQRAMSIARLGHLESYTNLLWWMWGDFSADALQEPTYSPSVFNFFRPDYQPPGLLIERGLVGPAFQIVDSYSSIAFPNRLWSITTDGLSRYEYKFPPDYSELVRVANDAAALTDQVNLLICGGTMTASTRDLFVNALNQVPAYDRLLRVRLAVFLAAAGPEGAVQR